MRRRNPDWRHDTLSCNEAAEMAITAWENDAACSKAWYTCVQEMKMRNDEAEHRRRLTRARTVQRKLWNLPVNMKVNVTNWQIRAHGSHPSGGYLKGAELAEQPTGHELQRRRTRCKLDRHVLPGQDGQKAHRDHQDGR